VTVFFSKRYLKTENAEECQIWHKGEQPIHGATMRVYSPHVTSDSVEH